MAIMVHFRFFLDMLPLDDRESATIVPVNEVHTPEQEMLQSEPIQNKNNQNFGAVQSWKKSKILSQIRNLPQQWSKSQLRNTWMVAPACAGSTPSWLKKRGKAAPRAVDVNTITSLEQTQTHILCYTDIPTDCNVHVENEV